MEQDFSVHPMCHLTPMDLEIGDGEEWWECRHCGHVKNIAWVPREEPVRPDFKKLKVR